MIKIDKYNLPDTSIKTTEKYTIAEFEPRGFRLEQLATRLSSEVYTYFILYDYKGTISTDNDEVLELLKEKYRSGDYEAYSSEDDFYGDNLTIYYDEILAYQSDGSYQSIKYIPKWNTVYRKLAKSLVNLNNNPFEKEKFIGNALYKKCFQDEAFKNKNEWIKKFSPEWQVESLDPIHIFASLNSNKISNQNRIERINILFRLLDENSEKYLNIDFNGCPAPTTIHMIGARGENDQKQIWDYFFQVMDQSKALNIDFLIVKNWYGIDIGSFTIFLFWIDSKNFIPLDKYTLALLEKYKKLKNLPTTFEGYSSLLIKKNTNLYCNLALIAYDSSQQELFNNHDRDELEQYLIDNNIADAYLGTIADLTMIIPPVNNDIVDATLRKDVVIPERDELEGDLFNEDDITESVRKELDITVEATTSTGSVNVKIENSNNGLKLISLKPLKGCSKDFLKTLKEDENYIFDRAYNIQSDNKIVIDENISLSLFDIKDLKININAIVGKNGTGKSTLVELLFAIINNLACKKNINNDLIPIPSLKAELIFENIELYKISIFDDNINIYQYEKLEDSYEDPKLISIKEFGLSHLFYTIAVNYSQHALNCLDADNKWLNSLFHKNDAYQTPIVIEPYRDNGNIEINSQNELAKQRLLANILQKEEDSDNPKSSSRQVTEFYRVKALKFQLDDSKFEYVYKSNNEKVGFENLNQLMEDSLYVFFKIFKINNIGCSLNEYAKKYIFKKIITIALTYKHYNKYFNKENNSFKFQKAYFKKLNEDTSHITYKLKQVVNFLKFSELQYPLNTDTSYTVETCSDKIESIKMRNKDVVINRYLPPSFFKVDIILENDIKFASLSSGEKQKIYSTNSILYQINNLNSVDSKQTKLIEYKYINIILDEIELYFHPELQRKYVSELLYVISKAYINKIRGINICFVTHSPFILSDIPDSKILFLEKELDDITSKTIASKNEIKTFGANIHELLSHGFFMENGLIGDFAKDKINDIINYLNNKESKIDSKEKAKNTIEIIGEEFLRDKLLKMYNEKFDIPREEKIKQLEEEIERLKNDTYPN